MMKLILIIVSVITFFGAFAQKWDHVYGNNGTSESFKDIIECYDKGYLISGSYEQMHGNWLIKTDINGETIWEKVIKWEEVSVYRSSIIQDDNGNIIAVSNIAGNSTGLWPLIVKLDSCGNKVWCRVFKDENFTKGWFQDILVLDNNDIIALSYMDSDEELEVVFLYYIDQDGNLIWKRSYATENDYPLMASPAGYNVYKFNNDYIIDGFCYYPYPNNPTQVYLRPLFICIDSLFQEKWVLPYGVSDSIHGEVYRTTKINDSTFMGVGTRFIDGAQVSLLIFFNKDGQELGYSQILNEDIGSGIAANFIYDIERINDTLYLASSNFGTETMGNPYGDFVIDTAGNLFNFQSRPNTHGTSQLIKTFDNKFVIGTGYYEAKTDWDIYMYKINEDLEHDTLYTGNCTYDSLCPFQIQSGEIDISNCFIITDVKETPTPGEYFAGLNTIPVKAYPCPVNGSEVTFELQNTEHHQNMELRCFDIFGKEVHSEEVYPFQGESKVNIENWNRGIYFVIVYSNGLPVGECKFLVQ